MSLTIVGTPIGNYGDITLRAIETLKACDGIICEELKPARVLLKRIGAPVDKELWQLNEHSKPQELKELVELCRSKTMALISDAGTPGFCDPGANLVEACYKEGIPVDLNPGASSLMALLSVSGLQLTEFHFVGFLPAEKTERARKIQGLKSIKIPFVIMDTPYRLQATLQELAREFGGCRAVVGADLTGEQQKIAKGKLQSLASQNWAKTPFVLLVEP